MEKGLTQKIRDYANGADVFTVDEIASALGTKTFEYLRKIREVVKRLKARGEIISVSPGLYRYEMKPCPFTKVERMWRAMRIKEYFTRKDIVMLSGASKTHAKKYFIFLKKKGFIIAVSGKGYSEGVYRLADSDNAPLEHPKSPS